jgi:hypothetical protein
MKAMLTLSAALLLGACADGGNDATESAPSPPGKQIAPAPTGIVSDAELIALLADRLGEDAQALSLDRAWTITAGFPAEGQTVIPETQWICADSGARPGPRHIAVCTRFKGAELDDPGDIDLWRLQPASADAPMREDLFTAGIESGHWGEPGDVALIEIGPDRPAFVLSLPGSGFGRTTHGRAALYAANDEGFAARLTFGSMHGNPGACDPTADAGCADTLFSFECTLRSGRPADAAGYYPLTLEIRGSQGGRRVERDIPLQRTSNGYAAPPDTECDAG